jgi:hypothetical protein
MGSSSKSACRIESRNCTYVIGEQIFYCPTEKLETRLCRLYVALLTDNISYLKE